MPLKLEGKTALVTGASRGIGRAIALEFAREGADVVVNYVKAKDEAEKVVNEVKSLGRRAIAVKADVSKAKEAMWLIERAVKEFRRVDVLVNNAAVFLRHDFSKATEETWNATLDANLKSAFFCSKAVSEHMLRQKSGNILFISSISGNLPIEASPEYGVSKAGMIALTKNLALLLAPSVRVNCVAPGFTSTDMTGYAANPEKRKGREALVPLKKVNEPEDVAKAALFLACDDSRNVTGHVLVVDGGYSLRPLPKP
ncbi:MAG TPA: 3-oxoacyl-ACP reductase family protein [archaeon]|nr:3-oxoacyl-ACP reductase family protein [archaeon]